MKLLTQTDRDPDLAAAAASSANTARDAEKVKGAAKTNKQAPPTRMLYL